MSGSTDVSGPSWARHAAQPNGALYGQPAEALGLDQGAVWLGADGSVHWLASPGQPDPEQERIAQVQAQEQRWRAEQWALMVRGAAASRLELFSARHAEYAWQARNSFGIGPVAVALVHVEPQQRPEAKVAGKLFADSDATQDVRDVLHDVCQVAAGIVSSGGDVRAELSEAPEQMSVFAQYAGAGVSLLDTADGSWRDAVKQSTGGGLHLPGRIVALLADGTRLVADRYPLRRHPHYVVQASNRLGADWSRFGRLCRYRPELADDHDDKTPEVDGRIWHLLRELNAIVADARDGSR